MELAKESTRFNNLKMPDALARKFKLLRLSLTLAAPSDPKESEELTEIASQMEGMYGNGKYCPAPQQVPGPGRPRARSCGPAPIPKSCWTPGAAGTPLRRPCGRFHAYVELANKGARELGFADTGAMWRSKYDMPPDAFAAELDRLWEQVRPLYLSLHAYVRAKLREKYGDVVPANGPIPAHLLGNMWAQEWENIYPLVAPKDADPGYDLTAILKAKNTEPLEMVQYGEGFFTSLGFAPLPQTFWERSLFVKPRDRDVVCHASAWDVDHGGRSAHQDVHRDHRRRFQHHPSRAGPQLLPARLQHAAVPVPRQRQRRFPRSHRRHHRAVGHAGIPGEDRAARRACPTARRTSGCCCTRRWRRSRSCRSA